MKVKMFSTMFEDGLEKMVNEWLAENTALHILNLQYQSTGSQCSVCITYEEGLAHHEG